MMSSRDDWVPVVAGVVIGAGLLVAVYKLFFSSPVSYTKGCNQNIGASKYVCTCDKGGPSLRHAKKNYMYSAEELERRENANRSRGPGPGSPDSTPPTESWHFFTWIDSQGTKLWMPVLGSTAIMGLLALLYKNMGKLKAYIWKTKTCDSYTMKRASKPSREKIKLCICKD